MLEDFYNWKLYIKLDTVADEAIARLQQIVGDLRWGDNEKLDGKFIRSREGLYICSEDQVLFWEGYLPDDKMEITLTDFIDYYTEPVPYKDVDVMTVFAGE